MSEFIWYLRCMIAAKRYKTDEYLWYRYLVLFDIKRFFEPLFFWKRTNKDELPF